MSQIATFHSHYGAISFLRRLEALGDEEARMVPAPRKLSISCGSAVRFSLPFDEATMTDDDTERVFNEEDNDYILIFDNE
jgi:hypothetical protein